VLLYSPERPGLLFKELTQQQSDYFFHHCILINGEAQGYIRIRP
jgi:hypothetical protein